MPPFVFHSGDQPLLLSVPHMGTYLPADIEQRLAPEARRLIDTDWHLDRLYDFAQSLGISVLMATHSRYVVDLNRPPDDTNLYPGQDATGLCPLDDFDRVPLYLPRQEPDDVEVAKRRVRWWQPYHHQLDEELERLLQRHGRVVLWDAHSIRSRLPRFFEGQLPDFNLGTANGQSCDAVLATALLAEARSFPNHSAVLDGRFKGGYITRHYGAPLRGIHAVQLEITQSTYMNESWPFEFCPERAEPLRINLQRLLKLSLHFASSGTVPSEQVPPAPHY